MDVPELDEERFARTHDYLEERGGTSLESLSVEVDSYLRRIGKFVVLDASSQILEVGSGTGWFLILCSRRGLSCRGLELNPLSVRFARRLGAEHGMDLDIQQGSIEDADIGTNRYDAVIALSVFEHVKDAPRGIVNVYNALRPGGVFYFYSTNKFSFKSGEYRFPLYGWLPYSWRRRLRVARQGEWVVRSSGIDFNQFTYFGLRRLFERVGFSKVVDQFDFLEPEDLLQPTLYRSPGMKAYRAFPPLKNLLRVFYSGNCFICVK